MSRLLDHRRPASGLNVPYDCGIVICARSDVHRAAMSQFASYFIRGGDEDRNGMDWVPEA